MPTLVHLSDLHFGRIHLPTVQPLMEMIGRIQPDLVAVSGDLTQRARIRQFREAAAFLRALPAPTLVVPGNHDVPLYDLARRVFFPLTRYRRYVTRDLAPLHASEGLAAAGLNTARTFTFSGGTVRTDDVVRAGAHFAAHPDALRVVVLHHPLHLPPAMVHMPLVRRASWALPRLAEAGVDVVLTGHLHRKGVERVESGGRHMVVVCAGTATSSRLREEANTFNLLVAEGDRLLVQHFEWAENAQSFACQSSLRFRRVRNGWAET